MDTFHNAILRNVVVALAISCDPEAETVLEQAAAHDSEPLVRERTAWALEQIRDRMQPR